MSFNDLGLSKEILSTIEGLGYKDPTEIQSRVIPLILQKKDLLGKAQTGTGKTASFMLPTLQLLHLQKKNKGLTGPRALILAPTRELAVQVHDSAKRYGQDLQLKSTIVCGGCPIQPQSRILRRGVDLLVSTPGRLLDHVSQKNVNLASVDFLILDEADCMLDMGFIHDIRKIMSYLPRKRQTLVFSATFSNSIKKLAEDLLNQPETIQVVQKNIVSDQVKQTIYPVDRSRKFEILDHLMTTSNWEQVLVFTRTKYSANQLCEKLKKQEMSADAIHGDKSQAARSKALKNFKKGKTRVLVATDVAARGLDIHQLSCVINYELPFVATDYVHRIGRTGRAGCEGEAISLVSSDELKFMKAIEKLIHKDLEKTVLKGFEVTKPFKSKLDGRKRKVNQLRSFGFKARKKRTSQHQRKRTASGSRKAKFTK